MGMGLYNGYIYMHYIHLEPGTAFFSTFYLFFFFVLITAFWDFLESVEKQIHARF